MDAPELADAQSLNYASAQVEEARPPSSNESGRHAKKRNRTETAMREPRRTYGFDGSFAYRSYARYSPRGYRW